MPESSHFDVVIIGAGAAGLMCAIQAAKRGRCVVLLERNSQAGRKILISGGGRCNFTNLNTTAANYISRNPHFAKSALARYTPAHFINLVEQHGIPYHQKTLGQLFCDHSARDILRLLEAECRTAGVRLQTSCTVTGVNRDGAGFHLATSAGTYHTQSLVVATGGLSIPKIGATSFGYGLARQFGLAIVECRPALVPLTFSRGDREKFADLAGVALDVEARAAKAAFRERMLFTHRGISGPAILQASSYWSPGAPLLLNLLPDVDLAAELAAARSAGDTATLQTALCRRLPKRFADRWLALHPALPAAQPLATLADRAIQGLCSELRAWRFQPAGTEGYEKAEVTGGGVDTAELSSQTMESRKVPGLFFIGEVVDVTGQLGGFNFQWAWASGYCSGQAV